MVNLWKNMAIQLNFNRFSKWMGWPSGSRKQVPAQRASPKKNPQKNGLFVGVFGIGGSPKESAEFPFRGFFPKSG